MTERERWVVYPLLFLALGAALRDKLFDRTTTKSIVCQELTIVDEQPLGREPILLARIGRGQRTAAGAPPGGYLLLNGQLEVVDGDPLGSRPVPVIAKIGRAEQARNVPSSGYMIVNGQLDVQGVVNARQYAYQGVPFLPALQGLPLGISWPDLVRALQQAAQTGQPQRAPTKQAPKAQPSEQSPPAEPLADPAENQ
ncbi:MAG: hypothetical protein WD738_02305 [Pirellulales bacterium]